MEQQKLTSLGTTLKFRENDYEKARHDLEGFTQNSNSLFNEVLCLAINH